MPAVLSRVIPCGGYVVGALSLCLANDRPDARLSFAPAAWPEVVLRSIVSALPWAIFSGSAIDPDDSQATPPTLRKGGERHYILDRLGNR